VNKKIKIRNDKGVENDALAPVIISASRATDIPAFYAKWFLHRLKKGHLAWTNPFNQRLSYVSFANTRVIVFWTKNPQPMMNYLDEIDAIGMNYYFQFTLNDYGRERFEPGVAPLEKRIETFRALVDRIGKERVIWRFDPMILGVGLTPEILAGKVRRIGNQIKGYTDKLVFSFLDLYRKVKRNLGPNAVEIDEGQRRVIVDHLLDIQKQWRREGWELALATCAENGDYEGIEHNHCIDGNLIRKLFGKDEKLVEYLRANAEQETMRQTQKKRRESQQSLFDDLGGDIAALNATKTSKIIRIYEKDSGQRPECGCDTSKDIGEYHTCPHGCRYCYANDTPEKAQGNCKSLMWLMQGGEYSESLVPQK
jgi:DNA repair photolyase